MSTSSVENTSARSVSSSAPSAGGPHHTVLSTQLGAEELTDLAEVFDTELVLIDDDTTRRSLAKELRWSAAYHRLAARL